MENTIFKLVLWDRAWDPVGSYERSNITVGLSLVSEQCSTTYSLEAFVFCTFTHQGFSEIQILNLEDKNKYFNKGKENPQIVS